MTSVHFYLSFGLIGQYRAYLTLVYLFCANCLIVGGPGDLQ